MRAMRLKWKGIWRILIRRSARIAGNVRRSARRRLFCSDSVGLPVNRDVGFGWIVPGGMRLRRNMGRKLGQGFCEAVVLIWKDIRDVKWAVILLAAYFVFGKYYLYSLCPVLTITGFPCPGCGLTRAGILLMRGDFVGAWGMHPFSYGVAGYGVVFGWNRYVRKMRMGRWLRGVFIMGLWGMVLYYVWRMYCYFPGEAPMEYYEGNLLSVNCIKDIDLV